MRKLPWTGIARWGVAGIMFLTLSGCMMTATPAIPPDSGENVG